MAWKRRDSVWTLLYEHGRGYPAAVQPGDRVTTVTGTATVEMVDVADGEIHVRDHSGVRRIRVQAIGSLKLVEKETADA